MTRQLREITLPKNRQSTTTTTTTPGSCRSNLVVSALSGPPLSRAQPHLFPSRLFIVPTRLALVLPALSGLSAHLSRLGSPVHKIQPSSVNCRCAREGSPKERTERLLSQSGSLQIGSCQSWGRRSVIVSPLSRRYRSSSFVTSLPPTSPIPKPSLAFAVPKIAQVRRWSCSGLSLSLSFCWTIPIPLLFPHSMEPPGPPSGAVG